MYFAIMALIGILLKRSVGAGVLQAMFFTVAHPILPILQTVLYSCMRVEKEGLTSTLLNQELHQSTSISTLEGKGGGEDTNGQEDNEGAIYLEDDQEVV